MRDNPHIPTTRKRAVLTLLALSAVAMTTLRVGAGSVMPEEAAGASDVVTYQAIVTELLAGTPYHVAVGNQLRAVGYATREVFN